MLERNQSTMYTMQGKKIYRYHPQSSIIRLHSNNSNGRMSANSYSTVWEMERSMKKSIEETPFTNTGTNTDEVIYPSAKRLKRTVSYVTNLSDLPRMRLKMEDVEVLTSAFAQLDVVPKSTIKTVYFQVPITAKRNTMKTIGSALATTAMDAEKSTRKGPDFARLAREVTVDLACHLRKE